MPRRLKPTNPTAADAILVGDPGRALMLAQELLVNPLMSNHARGLWGYSAETPDGAPLTIQSTGMGGPSAAAVLTDLWRLGLRRAIRVGSCVAVDPEFVAGDIVIAECALAADGTGRALIEGAEPRDTSPPWVAPDGGLTSALSDAGRIATTLSLDLAPGVLDATGLSTRPPTELGGTHRPAVADLQTAALFALGRTLGVAVAAILVVEGHPEEEERMRTAGRAAAEALSKAQA